MAPVESDGFCLRKGKLEVGADIRRVWQVLVAEVYTAGIFSGVGGVFIAVDSMPRQCCLG